jgi:preprotein translocase subunit SecA
MMGQIKEESVGYLYNLEVEVRRPAEGEAEVEAKGLGATPVEGQRLQYSAANDAGEVEVRNDRGQVQQAATSRLRQAAASTAPAPAPVAEAPRGAFGQRTDTAAPAAAPQNRAQRRAADRMRLLRSSTRSSSDSQTTSARMSKLPAVSTR